LAAESNVGPCVKAASDGGELTDVGLEEMTSLTSISGLAWPAERFVWPEIERGLERDDAALPGLFGAMREARGALS
jgi:hypothetical protein